MYMYRYLNTKLISFQAAKQSCYSPYWGNMGKD